MASTSSTANCMNMRFPTLRFKFFQRTPKVVDAPPRDNPTPDIGQILDFITKNPDVLKHPDVQKIIHDRPRARPHLSAEIEEELRDDNRAESARGLNNPDAISRPPQSKKTDEMFEVIDKYGKEVISVFLLHNKQQHANQLLARHRQRYDGKRRVCCIHSGSKASSDADGLIGKYVSGDEPLDVITLVNPVQLSKIRDFFRIVLKRLPGTSIHVFCDEADATYPVIVKSMSLLEPELQQSPKLRCTLVTATMPADNDGKSCMWK